MTFLCVYFHLTSAIDSYGPKFVENITQAISRDILCFAMKNLEDQRIVAHVHDELIIECPQASPVTMSPVTMSPVTMSPVTMSLEEITNRMSITPNWAPGLILKADGYCCRYYQKD